MDIILKDHSVAITTKSTVLEPETPWFEESWSLILGELQKQPGFGPEHPALRNSA